MTILSVKFQPTLIFVLILCSVDLYAKVPSAYQRIARENKIPPALLYAIALAESGQRQWSQQQFRPWPWTLNVNGQGTYYPSRRAAWIALQAALVTNRNVDIGLMQVSWRYHRRDLGTTWQALDPHHNLRVSAAILQRCFTRVGDWQKAVGCYHAPNDPVRAARYQKRVSQYWASK